MKTSTVKPFVTWKLVCGSRWRTSKLILSRIWIWIINCDKWKIHCHFFNRSDRELAHGRAVFSLCCQLSLFYWLKESSIYSRKLKKIFFQDVKILRTSLNILRFLFCKSWGFVCILFSYTVFFFTPLPFTSICDQPSSQRSDQSSSWFEANRWGRAGFELVSSWLAWILIFRQRLASAQVQVCDDDPLYWHRFNNPQSEAGDNM